MVDADLADALDDDPDGRLADTLNGALRTEVGARQKQRETVGQQPDERPFESLRELLDYLDERDGPVGPEHEPEIQRLVDFMESLRR
jgi:hypothetical protein